MLPNDEINTGVRAPYFGIVTEDPQIITARIPRPITAFVWYDPLNREMDESIRNLSTSYDWDSSPGGFAGL
jgi:hypothetical protein